LAALIRKTLADVIASVPDLKMLSQSVLCFATAGLLLAGCVGAPGGGANSSNEGPSAAALYASFVNRKRAPELPAETPALKGAILSHTASAITIRDMSDDRHAASARSS
jgi:hypothetical protein